MKLRPWEIDRMTFPEMEMALAEDIEKPLDGADITDPIEQEEYFAWWRTLTWEQKLEIARERLS